MLDRAGLHSFVARYFSARTTMWPRLRTDEAVAEPLPRIWFRAPNAAGGLGPRYKAAMAAIVAHLYLEAARIQATVARTQKRHNARQPELAPSHRFSMPSVHDSD